jgi:hypothetical protein
MLGRAGVLLLQFAQLCIELITQMITQTVTGITNWFDYVNR